jgi:hypothetical protein
MAQVVLAALLAIVAVACSSTPAGTPAPTADDGPAVPIACLGLEEPDCTHAFEAAATELAEGDEVVYAEVGPFGCPVDAGCPYTLAARPAGQVVLERATGDPVTISVTAAADGTITTVPGEWLTVAVGPSSTAGQLGVDPIPYSLGHCGLMSGVDVDGSWWDAVGFVDIDHADSINAAAGTFVPTDPNHATFTSAGGFTADVVRRVGNKHLPMCM